jgi:hypothetical protein
MHLFLTAHVLPFAPGTPSCTSASPPAPCAPESTRPHRKRERPYETPGGMSCHVRATEPERNRAAGNTSAPPGCILVLQWHFCCEECSQGPTSLIVVIRRAALRPAAPVGPGQDVVGGWRHRQDQAPHQPAHLLDAQREARPRPTLNAARLLPV